MKILKIILLVVIGLIALVLIVALFVKKDFAIVRQVEIDKAKTEVFEFARFLGNQDKFSVWAKADPEMQRGFRGTDGTVGSVSTWDSKIKDVGKGEQEITKITGSERIDYELRFIKPFESKNRAYMTFESTGDSTTLVKWGLEGQMNYPSNLMLLFMDFDAMMGKDLEMGLHNLKAILEK